MTNAHAWLPRASCDESCVRLEPVGAFGSVVRVLRRTVRTLLILMVLPAIPVLSIPQPGQARLVRWYCWLVLRCMGVRITKSGGPIRNVPGVLVVSPHMSWGDALVIHALMSGNFVAKAELIGWARADGTHHERHPDRPRQASAASRGGGHRGRAAAFGPDGGRIPGGHDMV